MLIRKGFRFRLKTDRKGEAILTRFAGSCRFVWNKALALQKEQLEAKKKLFSFAEMSRLLTTWRKEAETAWLKEIHSRPLGQTLRVLDRTIKNAISKETAIRFPRFKKKGQHDSFCYSRDFKFDGSRVFIPKIGWFHFYKSRNIEGIPKNLIVSKKGKHWFISVQCEIEIDEPVHQSTTSVGIDLGIRRFATLSDGSYYKSLNVFRKNEKKLAREQRKLSRKVKGSSNWKKQKDRIATLLIHIADTRKDYLHKISTAISKNHAIVVLEDLRVSNMSKSAKGTRKKPGHNVAAKSGLNKAILDQGWHKFRLMLEYKQAWRGGHVFVVPPYYTSQTCPKCGHVAKENREKGRFLCCLCGYKAHADYVGALNILAAGQAVSACGAGRAQAPV